MIKSILKSVRRLASKSINTKVWMRYQQLTLKVAHRATDGKFSNWIVRRPEWVSQYPLGTLAKFQPSSPLAPSHETLARVKAFIEEMSRDDELVSSGTIWDVYRNTLYAPLFDAFKNESDREFTANLFRTSTVNGYSYGTTFDDAPHRWSYVPIHIELNVIILCEYLGILRSECADQGEKCFWRKQYSPEEVVEKLENRLGFSLDHPKIGNPRGINFGGRFLTRETGAQIYTALRIAEAAKGDHLKILEIGGGYGGLCYWLHKVLGTRIELYNLIDIPEACVVQGMFLEGATLPNEGDGKLKIWQHTQLDKIKDVNLVINQDSLPEMGNLEAKRYIDWISRNVKGRFLSFNQEAWSGNMSSGELQASVPEIVSKFSNIKRVSRNRSWERRGYVEEAYVVGER